MIHFLPFSSFILVSVKIWTFAKFTIETAGFRKGWQGYIFVSCIVEILSGYWSMY